MFHTASPSPIVPLSTLGSTIVPHTTIVPSLPQSPAPPSPPVWSPPVIPSPPSIPSPHLAQIPATEKSLVDSWAAASSSAKLDEHVMHHSNMYKPSYDAPAAVRPVVEAPQPVVEARKRELDEKRTKLRELREARLRRQSSQAKSESTSASSSVVHVVTVDEERDPEAPQMTLMTNSRPVSFPSVPVHEPIVVPEPVEVAESVMSEPIAVAESVVSEPVAVEVSDVIMAESAATLQRIPSPVSLESDLPSLIPVYPQSTSTVEPPLIPISVASERLREGSPSRA
ncbi:hypothetical protein FS749_004879, partial [Ceratobasidium sp. UAMH 11750]